MVLVVLLTLTVLVVLLALLELLLTGLLLLGFLNRRLNGFLNACCGLGNLTHRLFVLLVSVSDRLGYVLVVNLWEWNLNLLFAGASATLLLACLRCGLGEFLLPGGFTCNCCRLLLDGLLCRLLLCCLLIGCFILIVIVLAAALFLSLSSWSVFLLRLFLLGSLGLIGLLYLFLIGLGRVLLLLYGFGLAVLIGGIDFFGIALAGYLLAVAALLFWLVLGGRYCLLVQNVINQLVLVILCLDAHLFCNGLELIQTLAL